MIAPCVGFLLASASFADTHEVYPLAAPWSSCSPTSAAEGRAPSTPRSILGAASRTRRSRSDQADRAVSPGGSRSAVLDLEPVHARGLSIWWMRIKTWKESTDPDYEQETERVLDLYALADGKRQRRECDEPPSSARTASGTCSPPTTCGPTSSTGTSSRANAAASSSRSCATSARCTHRTSGWRSSLTTSARTRPPRPTRALGTTPPPNNELAYVQA